MVFAIRSRLVRWRRRLALALGLLLLGAVIAASHVPGGSGDPMEGGNHMDGAALCLAVLGTGGMLAIAAIPALRMRLRAPRRLFTSTSLAPRTPPSAPPARAGPALLQVLRL